MTAGLSLKRGAGSLVSVLGVAAVFIGGVAVGVYGGTKAWHDGCIVEVNLGAKLLKSDCSARRRDGSFVEFVKPMEPLPLLAALQRVAGMTEGRDPERVFIDSGLNNAAFAQQVVTPPEGRQGSLAIIRQLLVDANASGKVDICIVPSGYRVQLAPPQLVTSIPGNSRQ